jgi:integrase
MTDPLYNFPARCQICNEKFNARYNVRNRGKVCTEPSHKCIKGSLTLASGAHKPIPCVDNCCRSQYRSGAVQSMDQAIDRTKMLTDEEFLGAIREMKREMDPAGIALRFIAFTGCRLGEALLVYPPDVSFGGLIATVKVCTLKRKGRPRRTVDLHDSDFIIELAQWMKGRSATTPLFPVPRRTLQHRMSAVLKRLNLSKDSCVHLLRHTRASQLVRAGATWTYIRQSLGWSTLEMANVYTHTDDIERTSIADRLPGLR